VDTFLSAEESRPLQARIPALFKLLGEPIFLDN